MNTFITQAGYVISSKSVVLTQSFVPFEAVSHLSATVHSLSFFWHSLRQAIPFLVSSVLYATVLCAFDRGVQRLASAPVKAQQSLTKRSLFAFFYFSITQRYDP